MNFANFYRAKFIICEKNSSSMKGMFRPLNLALSLSDKLILDTPVESTHTVESAV
jgi:hypothetical protein